MNEPNEDDTVGRLIRGAGPRPAVRGDVAARVRANVHDAWRAGIETKPDRGRLIWTLPLAAAIATAVILTVTNRTTPTAQPWIVAHVDRVSGNGSRFHAGEGIVARSTITTANERASFVLGDGTSIRIDEHSRVRFDTPHRIAVDSGAVYITTARSGIRVATPFGTVRDIGTRFEVRVTPGAARVRVRDGSVMLASHRAGRGEQLDVTSAGAVTTGPAPTWGGEWEWTMDLTPPFTLEGASVAQFLGWVSAESGLEVRYATTAIEQRAKQTTLHGSAGALHPDVAAKAILPTAGLHATIEDGVIRVTP